MTTQFEIDCAIMAGRAYQQSRDKTNWFSVPDGWTEFSHVPNQTFQTSGGFEAVSFQKANQNEGMQKVASLEQERIKAESKGKQTRLVAPVDGTVQQLAIHTIGGVVTPAQPLMVIVPRSNALEVEAYIENKDIGFVKAGQEAEIKVETFQYTKYGTIHAKVLSVSHDAINDEKKGLIYSARVRMGRNSMDVDGTEVNLSPGMAVSTEIKTGKRRVIEYFLSPLLQYGHESLRER